MPNINHLDPAGIIQHIYVENDCRDLPLTRNILTNLPGREIRIIVQPERIGDAQIVYLSQDIAKKIEEELTYPGEIKVTVIRETRSIEYAR